MKKIRVQRKGDDWICICGNTRADEGYEADTRERRIYGVYLYVCLRCGVKFDEETLEVVGMRFSSDLKNELVPPDYFQQLERQRRAYWRKHSKGITRL